MNLAIPKPWIQLSQAGPILGVVMCRASCLTWWCFGSLLTQDILWFSQERGMHSKNTCKFSVLLAAGPELPQAPAQSTLNPGGSGYIQEKRKHDFTTHSDHFAVPLNEIHFLQDIQPAQHHSWALKMKAEHKLRGSSLIPSMSTIGNLNNYGPVSCPTSFPLSVFTFRGMLLLVCLVHQRLGHVGASRSTLEWEGMSEHSCGIVWVGIIEVQRESVTVRLTLPDLLRTTETVSNGQNRQEDAKTRTPEKLSPMHRSRGSPSSMWPELSWGCWLGAA